MESLIENIKNEVSKYKVVIQLFTGLISVLAGGLSVITSFLNSPLSIAIVCVGVFFISLSICNKLISAKRESLGVIVDRLSPKQIKVVKRIRIGSHSLLLIPLCLAISFFITKSSKCNGFKNNVGVIITSFTNSNDDDFSYKLFKILDAELESNDTVSAIRSEKFINAGSNSYKDTLKELFNSNCFEKGLLVFGKRSELSRLFDCSIFINNVSRINESIGVQNRKIINLQNPDLINFSIESQAQIVSEFILGLLYYNSKNFQLSKNKFQHCLELSSNENGALKSNCALFIGNSLYQEKQFAKAIRQYDIGLVYDSSNAYLHYNMASAYLNNGDSLKAYYNYLNANYLNNKLINPLAEMEFATVLNEGTNSPVVGKDIGVPTGYFMITKGNKCGIEDKKGKIIVNCKFDDIMNLVYVFGNKIFFIVENNGKLGALNEAGEIVVPVNNPSREKVEFLIRTRLF